MAKVNDKVSEALKFWVRVLRVWFDDGLLLIGGAAYFALHGLHGLTWCVVTGIVLCIAIHTFRTFAPRRAVLTSAELQAWQILARKFVETEHRMTQLEATNGQPKSPKNMMNPFPMAHFPDGPAGQ